MSVIAGISILLNISLICQWHICKSKQIQPEIFRKQRPGKHKTLKRQKYEKNGYLRLNDPSNPCSSDQGDIDTSDSASSSEMMSDENTNVKNNFESISLVTIPTTGIT